MTVQLEPIPDHRTTTIIVGIGKRLWTISSQQFLEQGMPKPDDRGCWIWNGFLVPKGYGKFYTGSGRGNTATSAHRIAYQLYVGRIPAGLVIDHLCNNKRCVNPIHLKATTNADNVGRAMRRSVCPKGHPLTSDNTYRRSHGTPHPTCRKCERVRCLAYYYRVGKEKRCRGTT